MTFSCSPIYYSTSYWFQHKSHFSDKRNLLILRWVPLANFQFRVISMTLHGQQRVGSFCSEVKRRISNRERKRKWGLTLAISISRKLRQRKYCEAKWETVWAAWWGSVFKKNEAKIFLKQPSSYSLISFFSLISFLAIVFSFNMTL